jgi:3-oxoacyl-[acyl-carrier-protein] synthase III
MPAQGMLSGVTVVNNWIRQGAIERALVVSGEYISQLGQNAARHIRTIMSKELASLTLGDAGAALLLERAPAGAAGYQARRLHHRCRLQQAVSWLSEGCRPRRANVHRREGDPPGRHVDHPDPFTRSAR